MSASGTALVSDHASRDLHALIAKQPEFDVGDYEGAIKGALAQEDATLLDSKIDSAEATQSGSTVAICLINLTKGDLVVANLGDSHVMLAERQPKSGKPYHMVSEIVLLPTSRKVHLIFIFFFFLPSCDELATS